MKKICRSAQRGAESGETERH